MSNMYDELKNKLPATFLDADKVAIFASLMGGRINRGKQEYPEEYKFDPLDEAQQECLDIAVYVMILWYRIGELKKKIDEMGSQKNGQE